MAVIIDRNFIGCRTGEIEGACFTGSENWTMDIKAHLDGILKPHDVSGDLKMDVAHLDWQALHLMDTRFQTSQHLGVRFSSDLRKGMP